MCAGSGPFTLAVASSSGAMGRSRSGRRAPPPPTGSGRTLAGVMLSGRCRPTGAGEGPPDHRYRAADRQPLVAPLNGHRNVTLPGIENVTLMRRERRDRSGAARREPGGAHGAGSRAVTAPGPRNIPPAGGRRAQTCRRVRPDRPDPPWFPPERTAPGGPDVSSRSRSRSRARSCRSRLPSSSPLPPRSRSRRSRGSSARSWRLRWCRPSLSLPGGSRAR